MKEDTAAGLELPHFPRRHLRESRKQQAYAQMYVVVLPASFLGGPGWTGQPPEASWFPWEGLGRLQSLSHQRGAHGATSPFFSQGPSEYLPYWALGDT